MSKRMISFLITFLLVVTCVAAPHPVMASNGNIDFDDLINAGKKTPEITLYVDKTSVQPGETVRVTVSATDGEIEFSEILFTPLEDDSYEVVEGSVIGIGLEGAAASFDKSSGGRVLFSSSAVRTGDLFSYTIRISPEAVDPVMVDGDVQVKDGDTELPCLLINAQVTVVPGSDPEGKNGWVEESGKWYYYENNAKQTGWVKVSEKWYYMDGNGVMQTGWLKDGNVWYYLKPTGAMVTGEYTIDGKLNSFAGNGVWLGVVQQTAKNGWVQESGKWYYYKSGAKQTGWIQPNGTTWYYMDANGVMVTGEYTIGGKLHKFNDSGAWLGEVQQTARNGWVQESGKWYYYQNGAKKTGWVQVGTTWYYMDGSGVMQTGWLKSGNTWYYLQTSGAMATGWVQVGTAWYYMNTSGAMQTGWLKLGNTWYYLQSSGAMATGSLKIGAKTYQFNASGACLNP